MGDQGPKGNVKAGQKGKYMEIRRTQCSLQQVKALVLSGFQALAGGAVLARLVLCLLGVLWGVLFGLQVQANCCSWM